MNIKKALANKKNYGAARATSSIKYIVIHYTGNDGDTDESNGRYFQNNVTGTSAHYFVDDDSITQTVPDNFVAHHCGTTKGYKHKYCRNSNSIGIEICDDVRNGTIYPSAKTVANTLDI
jgi:N-acetylmuramoyl-L-alanine amidase CwlA